MNDELEVFNGGFGKLRTVVENEDVWFLAKDVSDILEYRNAPDMVRNLDADEKLVRTVCVSGQNRGVNFINESGLYHAVIQSKKPEAKKFRKWVTSEVLPSIRKTGGYTVVPKTFAEALRLAANQSEQLEQQKVQLTLQAPKVEFAEAVMGSDDAFDMATVAKTLNMGKGRNELFAFLRDNKVLQHDNQPYQTYVDKGYFRVIEQKFVVPDGTVKINIKTVVFQRGVDFIRKLILQERINVVMY